MRNPGMWAGIGAIPLVLAAPVMLVFGVILSISPPDYAPDSPDRLFGGGLASVLGAVITGALLLVARLRPEGRRRAWRVAAFVVVLLFLVIGPIWGVGSFFWVTNIR